MKNSGSAIPGSAAVQAVIDGYPPLIRDRLVHLRRLIHEVADERRVGPLTEALKWGEAAFLTEASKAGSTVRIGWQRATPDRYGIYFNCRTTLVEELRGLFGDDLKFEGQRAITLPVDEPLPEDKIRTCIGLALTYHARKRKP